MIPLRVDIQRHSVALFNGFLILLNIAVFFYELTLPPQQGQALVFAFGLTPAQMQLLFASPGITLGQAFLPLMTSMFLHGGWMHLLGNMLFLWVFGGSVEEALGHFQYMIFYLFCGVGGAISGVMGAFIVLFPRARVTTLIPALFLFFTVQIPAVLMLGYWFLIQFFSGVASLGVSNQGGVAWWAHIGGFLLG